MQTSDNVYEFGTAENAVAENADNGELAPIKWESYFSFGAVPVVAEVWN
jgi:hypothetical protein